MTDLELATNEELISELCRRASFLGIIINGKFDAEQHYGSNPGIDDVSVNYNNHLQADQIARILGSVQRQFADAE